MYRAMDLQLFFMNYSFFFMSCNLNFRATTKQLNN